MSAGHIEQVANQWRCYDHATGGCWVYDTEQQAVKALRALELRDAAQGIQERAETAFLERIERDGVMSVLREDDLLLVGRYLTPKARERLAAAAEDELKFALAKKIRETSGGS